MSRRRLGLVAVAVAALTALVTLEVVLPGVAERRIRDRLAPAGRVLDVDVRSRPAIALLWGSVDRVDVRMADLDAARLPRGDGGIERLAGVGVGTVSAASARSGELEARAVRADLRDGAVRLRADVPLRGLLDALGDLPVVDPRLRAERDALSVEVAGGGLASVGARVVAVRGRVVLQPQASAGPFTFGGGLGERTLVDDPDLAFTRIGGSRTAEGLALDLAGRLRAADR